ncbi:MAG: hypothetical protein U1B83_03275, partial [Candidatus Cloacimonadaceae bacterium]|nr:hypothetical protein [Candidatus Cloacimonadaceae bacterium]
SLEDNPADVPIKIEVCKSMGIKIIAPNINRSDSEFSVHGKEVLFGLRAIKNLGEAAMRAIIEDRDTNGPYTTVYSFCSRLDSSAVNKTVLESLIASGAMDELEGSRAQKWAVIETALAFSTGEQRDRKKGQTSVFDIISEDDTGEDYYPPLPTEEPWSYIYQLEKEKDVLGFYMSGHPLYEYRALIKHLSNANAISGKGKFSGDMILAGIVSRISRKKDNKGNPIAFVEFEDLAGRYEVALFSRDYLKYSNLLTPGKIFFVVGGKSGYNGNEDNMLRVNPQMILALEELNHAFTGELRINLSLANLSKGLLDDIERNLGKARGQFSLKTTISTPEGDSYQLDSQKKIFPNNALLNWLEKEKIDFHLRVNTLEKND